MILTAPDIVDRYWSVEVADAYISNVFYIGTRATEGKGGAHAFVVPNWNGKLPDGVVEHRLPTNSVIVAIRIGVKPGDAEDLKAVNALQDKFAITSLGNWGDPAKLGQASVPKLAERPHFSGDLGLFETLAELLKENPPPKDQEAAAILLRRGGTARRASPSTTTDRSIS